MLMLSFVWEATCLLYFICTQHCFIFASDSYFLHTALARLFFNSAFELDWLDSGLILCLKCIVAVQYLWHSTQPLFLLLFLPFVQYVFLHHLFKPFKTDTHSFTMQAHYNRVFPCLLREHYGHYIDRHVEADKTQSQGQQWITMNIIAVIIITIFQHNRAV